MHSAPWIALLRRIPPALHDSLAVMTTVGTEITIQAFVRVEEEYLVIRGRLAGTTDTGRVFFVPFDQINYLGFTREVKEPEILALYDEPEAGASLAPPPTPVDAPTPPPAEAEEAPPPVAGGEQATPL